MSRSFLFVCLLTGLLSLFSTNVLAADLYVNASGGEDSGDCTSQESPCLTIQYGLDQAAVSGDTINVAAGTYSENISISDKSFSLIGANAETTIIDGGASGRTFNIDGAVSSSVSIENVTIQNGSIGNWGGCLKVWISADLNLTDVVMKNCEATSNYYGGCLYYAGNAGGNLIIDRAYFTDCTAYRGSAIDINDEGGQDSENHQITNTTFYNNTASSNATLWTEENSTLTNVTFYQNSSAFGFNSINSNNIPEGGAVTLINTLLASDPTGGEKECDDAGGNDNRISGGGNISLEPSWQNSCNLDQPSDQLDETISAGTDIADSVSTTDNGVGYLAIPGTDSIMYNLGTNTNCASTDVREVTRPQFTTCDVGAFEYGATVSIDPSTADLSTTAGSSTTSSAITLTNDSAVSVTVNSINISGDAVFTVTSDNCTGESIAGSGTCTFKIQYAPTEEGSNSGTATVDSEASNSPSVALTGTASAVPVPALSKAPSSKAFANATVGSTPVCETITITSSGTGDLIISDVQLSDEDNFILENDTCDGSTLAVDEECTMSACFDPSTAGDKTATISITSNAATSPDSISLTGTGVSDTEGSFTFSSDTLDLSILVTGSEQKCSTLTATNVGSAEAIVSDVSISDDASSVFSISEDGCGGETIAVNGTCSILVCFSQADYAEHTATLTMTSDAASSPDTVALSGQAYEVRVSSVGVDMEVNVGRSTSQSVTVTVEGGSSVTFGVASIASVESSISKALATISVNGFTISEDTCSGETIASLGTCDITILFTGGTTAGSKAATLSILSDVNNLDVSLTGTVSDTSGSSGGCSIRDGLQGNGNHGFLYLLLAIVIMVYRRKAFLR